MKKALAVGISALQLLLVQVDCGRKPESTWTPYQASGSGTDLKGRSDSSRPAPDVASGTGVAKWVNAAAYCCRISQRPMAPALKVRILPPVPVVNVVSRTSRPLAPKDKGRQAEWSNGAFPAMGPGYRGARGETASSIALSIGLPRCAHEEVR